MNIRKELNILKRCRGLNVGLWSCPQFIFLVMGVVIILSILTAYLIATRYTEPDVVIGLVSFLTVFLLIITQVIVAAFEKVVRSRQQEIARAKEVLELKDQFVHIAVHDIASAATAIKWGLRTIEPGLAALSDADKELFGNVRERNERLIELARQILLITRIEGGRIALDPVRIDLGAFITELVTSGAKKNSHRVRWSPPHDPSQVTTDPTHLKEILHFLIDNAQSHTEPSRGSVLIMLADTTAGIEISVENSGPEMDPVNRAHVFEKFWRDEYGKHIVGSGFPLYIAKQLAKLLGGDIRCATLPDKTSFTVTLPHEWRGKVQTVQ